MKKIIAIISLVCVLSGFIQISNATTLIGGDRDEHGCIGSAGYSWNADKNQCTRAWEDTKETVKICTMEYAPVCSTNGVTYSNKCTAGNNEIAYAGECDKYIDNNLLKKLDIYKTRLNKQLENISNENLAKAIEKADLLIANIKLEKIAEEVKKYKITQYKFLRNLISTKLMSM